MSVHEITVAQLCTDLLALQNLLYYTQDFSAQYVDDFEQLPFDLDTLRNHVERLAMASAPWQIWAMNLRAVYRWEDPMRTGGWLALYIALWHTGIFLCFAESVLPLLTRPEHVMGFLVSVTAVSSAVLTRVLVGLHPLLHLKESILPFIHRASTRCD